MNETCLRINEKSLAFFRNDHGADALGTERDRVIANLPVSIFYRPTPETIDVIQILHHRRNLPPELES